jgi:mono/diheme cytochrome c family protein
MHPASKNSHRSRLATGVAVAAIFLPLSCGIYASAQNTRVTVIAQTAPVIKHIQIPYVSPVAGKQMYETYCATCHGTNGKGNVNAAALLPAPTDLTLLSSRNGGKFPQHSVHYLLMSPDTYHDRAGTSMPSWGDALKSLEMSNPDLIRIRVHNLMGYLEKMQAAPVDAGFVRQ